MKLGYTDEVCVCCAWNLLLSNEVQVLVRGSMSLEASFSIITNVRSYTLRLLAGHEQGVHRRRHRGDQESSEARAPAVLPAAACASRQEKRSP